MATGGKTERWLEEYIEYQCYVCETKKKVKNADWYCFDCPKLLCDKCLTYHNTFTDTHKVQPLSDDTIQKILTEKCEKHPNEVIQYFCRHHDALLCKLCQKQDHGKCTGVKQISEAADDLIADQNVQVVSGQLQSTIDRVNQVMDTIDNCVEIEQQVGDTSLKKLDYYEQTLIAKVRKLAEKGRNNITIAQNQIINTAKDRHNGCVKATELLSTYMEEVNRSQNRKAHLFILQKNGQGIVKEAEDICRESEDFIKNRPFGLVPDAEIAECLNAFSSLLTEVKLYTIGQRSNTKLNLSLDKGDCDILGSCRLGDGNLVLCDYKNKRLKRVDPSTNKVIDHFIMKETPSGLCSIGPQEIAVADWSNFVHIISTMKGLTPSRTVDMGQGTDILACHGGELFAGGDDSLRVHDMSGKMITDISLNTDGQSVFSGISGIAVNQTGDRVFVSDLYNGLVCMSRDGQVVFRLSNDDMGLNEAWGVTTDQRGSVMVAGLESDNVVQVTEEGRVVGEILARKDGIWRPICLSYDTDVRKLYVGGLRTSQLLGFELL